MARHNEIGQWGENIAVEQLTASGYAIRERNWRLPPYEVDIIAMKGNRVVFVEVKTRTEPIIDVTLAVTKAKQAHLVKSANAYMIANSLPHEVQFDIVIITRTGDSYTVDHLSDAFFPPLKSYR